MPLSFETFENECERRALVLEDRLLRYVSSPQEHNLMFDAGVWPFWQLMLERVFYIIKHRKRSETAKVRGTH